MLSGADMPGMSLPMKACLPDSQDELVQSMQAHPVGSEAEVFQLHFS